MVGLSVHGLLGVDTELQRSALAAQQQRMDQYHSVHVHYQRGDCHSVQDQAPSHRT